VLRLFVTANVVPSSPILVTLMMKALRSSETSVLTRPTRRKIREDGILHSHRREHLKSDMDEFGSRAEYFIRKSFRRSAREAEMSHFKFALFIHKSWH
jgi:hypothetical protein